MAVTLSCSMLFLSTLPGLTRLQVAAEQRQPAGLPVSLRLGGVQRHCRTGLVHHSPAQVQVSYSAHCPLTLSGVSFKKRPSKQPTFLD